MEVNCFFPPHNSNRGLGGANQEDSRLINSVAGPSVALLAGQADGPAA